MMNTRELANLLVHYGRRTSDVQFHEYVANMEYHTRISTYIYNSRHFYLAMCNGEIIECFELK